VKEKKLLIRPIPYSDEAPNGVLLRAAQENGWPEPRALLRSYATEYRRSLFTDSAYLQRCLDVLGVESDACLHIFETLRGGKLVNFANGLLLPFLFLRVETAPVCPACLTEHNYLRKAWCLHLRCCCDVHHCMLLFNCPKCKETLGGQRRGPSTCGCGFDFRTAEASSMSHGCAEILRALDSRHVNKIMGIATLFGWLEEADITRKAEDAEWSDAAVALYRNDERAVQYLVDIVHRGSGREHPRITLKNFLSTDGHVREIAKKALAQVQLRRSTGPPALPLEGVMSWSETRAALGLVSDGELHAIWKLCLVSGVTRDRRHAFTRESVNALLWKLSCPVSALYDSHVGLQHTRLTSSGLARLVLRALRDTSVVPFFELRYGISTLRLIESAAHIGVD